MGKHWDRGVAGVEYWRTVYRVLKPGAHLLAFGGTRTYHRMVCAIEDAGFEIRDTIMWLYGSGFPKSHDVSKGIDKAAGVDREDKFEGSFERRAGPTGNKRCDKCGKWLVSGSPCQCPRPQDKAVTNEARQWQGWGTALKPACEPIVLARKPLSEGTVAANVLKHGTGALNIDGCRVEHVTVDGGSLATNPHLRAGINGGNGGQIFPTEKERRVVTPNQSGRWPANVIHDGSEEVVQGFPDCRSTGDYPSGAKPTGEIFGGARSQGQIYSDSGSAARFFYCAKANKKERAGSKHPTVKPIKLLRYLVRLVTPPGGLVLDPFAGTGTTGEAAVSEGFRAVLIEREAEYQADIRRRVDAMAEQQSML